MSAALTLRQRGLSPAAIISKLSLVSLQHVVLFCLLPFCSKVPSYNLLSPLIFQTSSRCVSQHLEFFIYHLHLRSHLSCYFLTLNLILRLSALRCDPFLFLFGFPLSRTVGKNPTGFQGSRPWSKK